MRPIPKRLKQEPLIEAIWQVQIEPAPEQPVGDLLPGVLYSALRGSHPQLKLHRLPTADLPDPLAQIDPALRHAAKYRMEEPGSPFSFQVGERILTFNCRRPYVGWERFKAKILELIDIVATSGLVPAPHSHALRYIDLIALDPPPDLSALQLSLRLGERDIFKRPLQMRLELPDGDYMHTVQIATPAQAALPDGIRAGTVIDLETAPLGTLAGWDAARAQVEHLHERCKAMFFESILTPEAIGRMEPEY